MSDGGYQKAIQLINIRY